MEQAKEQMTLSELARIINVEIAASEAFISSDIEANRRSAYDYYHSTGEAVGETCKGRSSLVSNDVGDMIDAAMAQMLPAFSNDSMIATFEPENADDEEQAEEESRIISHIFMDTNRGYNIIRDSMFDALLSKTCGVKTSWEKTAEKDIVKYDNLTQEQIAEAYQQLEQSPDGKVRTIIDFTEPEEEGDGFSITIREESQGGFPKVVVVAPEEIRVNSDHDSMIVTDARFVAHKPSNITQSDLITMGFDEVLIDSLSSYSDSDIIGSRRASGSLGLNDSGDRSTRVIDVYECWLLVDFDGDGIAERRHVLISGSQIIENEEVTAVELITGSCMPMPHQFYGLSMYDKLRDLMNVKTTLIRQIIDNAAMNINNRLGILEGEVNLDDLTTSRAGGIVRMTRPDAILPIPKSPLDQSTPLLLAYMDKMRTERAGSALDMTSENIPIGANASAHGTERIITSMEQIQASMNMNYSESVIRGIYLNIHRLLRKHSTGPITVKLGSTYVTTDPREWQQRNKLNVGIGSSAAERTRKGIAVQGVMQAQQVAMEQGADGTLVNMKNVYNGLLDSARFAGLDFPEQYWVDPDSEEGQAAAQQKQQADAAAQQAAQQEKEQFMLFQQQQLKMMEGTKRQKAMLDAIAKDNDLMQQYEEMMNDMTLKITEMELKYEHNVPGSLV